jgi:hypothetical protein
MTVPRLQKNKGLRGPEPLGCFNSGFAPLIYRHYWSGQYMVGHQMDVEQVRRQVGLDFVRGVGKRVYRADRGRRVLVTKGRAPAVREFNRLCAAALAERRRDAEIVRAANQDVASGDPERVVRGALTLSDF